MKTLNFLLIVFILSSEIFAQNLEPAQQTYNVLGQTNVILSPETLNYFKQSKFTRSWHWENDHLINQVVNSNSFDISSKFNDCGTLSFLYNNSSNLFIRLSECDSEQYWTHCTGSNPNQFEIRSIQYEPTLIIDETKASNYELQTRQNDLTNPIFGFKLKSSNAVISNDENNTNYSRLILDYTPAQTEGEVVLDEPWVDDIMCHSFSTASNETEQNIQERKYFGKQTKMLRILK